MSTIRQTGRSISPHRKVDDISHHRQPLDGRHVFVSMAPHHRTLILLGVPLLLGGFLLVNLAQGRADLLLLWCAFAFKVFVAFIPLIFWQREYGWFHPLVFAALWGMVNMLLSQIPLYAFGLSYHRALPNTSPYDLTLLTAYHELLVGLGGLALLAGFFLCPRIPVPLFQIRKVSFVWLKIAVITAISLFAFFVWMRASGGLEGLLTMRGFGRADRIREGVSGAHWVKLINLLSLGLLVALSIRPRLFHHPGFWGFIVVSMFLNFSATGSRSSALMPLVMALVVYMLRERAIPYGRIVATGFLVIFLLGFLGQFRTAQFGQRGVLNLNPVYEFSAVDAFEEGVETLIGRGTTGHGGLPILARVPHEIPLLYGQSYVAWLFFPIPGALLPFEKPLQSGRLNGMINFNMQGGVPAGSVGEAYWNFHIPGVVMIFFIWGFVTRLLTDLYLRNSTIPGFGALYVYFLFSASPNGTSMAGWIQGSMVIALAVVLFAGIPRWVGMGRVR